MYYACFGRKNKNLCKRTGRKLGKGPKTGGGDDGLGPEDRHLWNHVTKEIAPLSPFAKPVDAAPPPAKQTPSPQRPQVKPSVSKTATPAKEQPQDVQVDARTDSRLRRGKIAIDARIDLHGHTQDQAHRSLNSFLLKCHAHDMRCVLVITGKGVKVFDAADDTPVRGVLKKMLPHWLSMQPLKSIVLKYYPAQIKDGGEGAFYIYLKRRR